MASVLTSLSSLSTLPTSIHCHLPISQQSRRQSMPTFMTAHARMIKISAIKPDERSRAVDAWRRELAYEKQKKIALWGLQVRGTRRQTDLRSTRRWSKSKPVFSLPRPCSTAVVLPIPTMDHGGSGECRLARKWFPELTTVPPSSESSAHKLGLHLL